MLTRRSTALAYLIKDHNMDENTGLIREALKARVAAYKKAMEDAAGAAAAVEDTPAEPSELIELDSDDKNDSDDDAIKLSDLSSI